MEIKKTKAADLESKRLTGFLLGLIFVLAVIFVAFEYTEHDKVTDDANDTMLDDLSHDVEMIPVMTQKNMVALAPKKQPAAIEKLKIVENNIDQQLPEDVVINSTGNSDSIADGQGAKDDTSDETTALSPLATDLKDNPLNFHIVEDLPQFPGGAVEFMKWLTRNLRYPLAAERQKIEGKVVVQFIVNRDGPVANIKVVKSLHPYCDSEAMRVMRMMPRWKPGIQADKPCRTMVSIPIMFKL